MLGVFADEDRAFYGLFHYRRERVFELLNFVFEAFGSGDA